MTESTWSNFSHNFRMCHIFCQLWFPLCRVVFAAVEMGDSLGWGERLRKLIEKHWKRYNLSIGNYVINFLFPIIEIAEACGRIINNSFNFYILKKHGRLRDPSLPQRRIDARGDWRNRKKYPKFVWSRLAWSGQNLTWHLSKPKTLFGKRHGLGRFLERTLSPMALVGCFVKMNDTFPNFSPKWETFSQIKSSQNLSI